MRVLVALDKFKDALSAREACETVRAALGSCGEDYEIDLCPLTDGGEGFVDVLTHALQGERLIVRATGPRGEPIDAAIGFVKRDAIPAAARALLDLPSEAAVSSFRARVAIIEMASVSGLALLPPHLRDPWQTSSVGTGQLIRAACGYAPLAIEGVDGTGIPPVRFKVAPMEQPHGWDAHATPSPTTPLSVSAILLGIGGSATNDLGAGALAQLGLCFLDVHGHAVSPVVPMAWPRVAEIQGQPVPLPPIRIACDVRNPLTGPNGATTVYGPQKGLRSDDLPRMESEVCRIATLLQQHCNPRNDFADMPGAGAAGGIAFGFATAFGARLAGGFDLLHAWCNLEERLQAADVVITGEGRFDATSLQGKGPGAIALRARGLGKTVHVFAGCVNAPPTPGIALHEISPVELPLAQALPLTRENLTAAVRRTFGRV